MSDTRQRRSGEPQLTVIFWRDIPAQVKAKAGRVRARAVLPDRFMFAVDAAATKAGKTSDDDYLAEWREESRDCLTDLQVEVDREAASIVESYPGNVIASYVRNGGWALPGDPPSGSP